MSELIITEENINSIFENIYEKCSIRVRDWSSSPKIGNLTNLTLLDFSYTKIKY